MKKLVYIFLVLALYGCSEDFLILENPNLRDSGNFFETEADIIAATNGIYANLREFPDIFYLYLAEGRSNNYFAGSGNAQRDLIDISVFNVTTELGTIEDAWNEGYSLIARANKVLSVLDDISFTTENLKTRIEAEARALRGFTYLELVKVFGKLPIIDKVVSPDEAVEIGRSDVLLVYELIEEDLLFASQNLPSSYNSEDVGRITQQAATGLLAHLYLTWAGFPLEDESKYAAAEDQLEDLVNGVVPMNWSTNFENIFKVSNDNRYALFEIQYISGAAGLGALFPTQFLTSSMKEFSFNGGIPRIAPSFNLMRSYDQDNDLRFEATFDTSFVTNFSLINTADLITKWFEPNIQLLNRNDWPQNYPILRPANIYLMYAEALIQQAQTPSNPAIDALNRTRIRAGLPPLGTDISKDEFLAELKAEYRREFVGEGHYWHYLVRSGNAINDMNQWFIETEQELTINENKLIYPLPFSQLAIKPGLYEQNPGY